MLCVQRVSAVSSGKYRQESDQSTDEECEAILSSVLKIPNIELMKINPDDVNLNHTTSYINIYFMIFANIGIQQNFMQNIHLSASIHPKFSAPSNPVFMVIA